MTGMTTTANVTTVHPDVIVENPWKLILLVPIIVLSVVAHILLLLTIKYHGTFRHMPFYYLLSLGLVHFLMAVVATPPEVLMEMMGSPLLYESSCSVWVTLDTFFCNNVLLHLLGASLDAMLKTRSPFKYGRAKPSGTVILKLGVPWTVSFVQSAVLFAISSHKAGLLDQYVCYLDDPNFHVLRFLLAFLFPLVIGLMFFIVSLLELKRHRSKTYWDSDKTEVKALFRSPSNESLNDFSNTNRACATTNSSGSMQQDLDKRRASKKDAKDDDETISELLPCVNSPCYSGNEQKVRFEFDIQPKSVRHRQLYLKRMLLTEERMSKILVYLYITNTLLWAPSIVASLLHSMCITCRSHMGNALFRNFKWASYFSSVLGPFIYMAISREVRNAYLRVVTCSVCRSVKF